jgi:PAS domain S-box-containing protein
MDLRTDEDFARLLLDSHARVTGRALIDADQGEKPTAEFLYTAAPFCLLAHDGGADPRFVYANRAAQSRFGYGWDEFVGLPSRLSAEAPERDERQRLLDAVTRDGYIDDYRGIRIAKSGQRFWIEKAIVWELVDAAGTRRGQAAMFRQTSDL